MSGIPGAGMIPIVRQGASGGIPPLDFNLDAITFDPQMAVRTGPAGVFAGSVIPQGKFDGSGTPDVLTYPRGDLVGNPTEYNYKNFDPYQFTGVKWWTPEKARDATQTNDEYLWYVSSEYSLRYEHDNQQLVFRFGGQEAVAAYTTVAGTEVCIVVSADVKNTIDGTNYARISINDTHTFDASTQPIASAPDATIAIGSNGTGLPANAILEGMTWTRRVISDGTYGKHFTPSSAGAVDEIAAIYAAGAGVDPATVVGGAWDATFCLPTDTDTTTPLEDNPANHAWSGPAVDAVVQHGYMEDGGYLGGAYVVYYNATNTVANAGSAAALDDLHAADFTVGVWFRCDSATSGTARYLVNKTGDRTVGWRTYYVPSTGTIGMIVECDTDAASTVNASTLMQDGKWHYVAFFYNQAGDRKIYIAIDGVWASSYTDQDASAGAIDSDAAEDLLIGAYSGGGNFLGAIGHASIWSDDHHSHGTDFIPPRTPPAAGGNLVESWKFDDGSGATAAATVTSPGNDAALTDHTWEEQHNIEGSPVVPQSHTFDGSVTNINYLSGVNIDDLGTGAMTVEGWFRLDKLGFYGPYLQKGNWSNGWALYRNNQTINVIIFTDTSNSIAQYSLGSYGDNCWHHLAFTYDDGGDRKARLYFDGILVDEGSAATGLYLSDAASSLFCGRRSSFYFNGAVGWHRLSDSVRYTGTAFVPPARNSCPGNDANAQLLIAMTDGAGTTATDGSGNGYNGTITPGDGKWLNTLDMSVDEPGAQIYNGGYNIASDGADDGIQQIDTVVAGEDYVVRAVLSVGQSGVAQPEVEIYDNTGAAIVTSFPGPKFTGAHTGANNSATLIDAAARFPQMLVGWSLYNVTDGSSTVITAVSGDMTTITGVLAGGTDDDWDTGDVYKLMPPNGIFSDYPWVETFCFEVPVGCTSIDYKVINPAGDGVVNIHQFEIQPNLVTNGGMETGAGNPWIPTGWTNLNLDPGDSAAASVAGEIHSGTDALQYNVGASEEGIYQINVFATDGDFYSFGIWLQATLNDIVPSTLGGGSQVAKHSDATDAWDDLIAPPAGWVEYPYVLRARADLGDFYLKGSAGTVYSDDIYLIALDPVTLTVTPASEANSLESGGIRVDGLDGCSQPVPAGYFSSTFGWFRWKMRPRHGDGDLEKFNANNYIALAFRDANNQIGVQCVNNTSIRLIVEVGAVITTQTWTPTNLVADTEQLFEVRYAGGSCVLIIDGAVVATVTPGGGIDFGALEPNMAWWGSQVGKVQTDAVFLAP